MAKRLKIGKKMLYLSHYLTFTRNEEPLHKSVINLHGHLHTTEIFYENRINMVNVCCDAWGCRPVEIEEIFDVIKNKKQEYAKQNNEIYAIERE